MRAPRVSLVRAARALFAPAAIAAPGAYLVYEAARRSSLTPFGRDQGIFQYIAWALAQGERAYRDVRDVNGPLTYLVHLAFLELGAADEHRFRILDLAVSALAFAATGVCLSAIAARAPRSADRAGWALAACVVLGAEYLAFNYWDVAQRESFFDWLILPSLALVVVARRPRHFAIAGALAAATWFGKPTYALFAIAEAVAIGADRRALDAYAGGAAISACAMLAFLAAAGDISAYARITLVDVPAMYRFIWPRSASDILTEHWYGTEVVLAATLGAATLALVVTRRLHRRFLAIALAPACGVASVLVQAKSFPYHWHPVTAGIGLQALALAAWSWRRFSLAARRRMRVVPIAIVALVALHAARMAVESPFLQAEWLADGARTPEARRTKAYFDHFPEPDFFPYELREAAAFLRENTREGDRVQVYGMDPYLLFLAGRLSATPYIYAYDLDVDAALQGGGETRPSEAQRERIRAMQREHERDLLERLERSPPAAFVFLDKSPLMSEEDAHADFAACCARASAWVDARYTEAARFGAARIWLRRAL